MREGEANGPGFSAKRRRVALPNTLRRLVVAGLIVALASSGAYAGVRVPTVPKVGSVSAEAQATAAESYKLASKALNRGRMATALEHAQAAYAAAPNTSTALLRAVVLAANKRHLEAFEAYLVAFSLTPTEDELRYIREGLQRESLLVTPQLGWLKVSANPTNARVMVGPVGFSPGLFVAITKGRHEVVVQAPGHTPQRRTIEIAAATSHMVSFELIKVAADSNKGDPNKGDPNKGDPNVAVDASSDTGSDVAVVGGSLVGIGAVFLVAGIGTHIWGLDRASETARLADPSLSLTDDERLTQHGAAAADAKLGRALSIVGYTLGVASAAAGILYWVLAEDTPDDDSATGTVSWRPTVAPIAGGATLSLGGQF